MNNIRIYKATKEDAPFVHSCVTALADHVNQRNYLKSKIEDIENEISKDQSSCVILIAALNNEKIGFALYSTIFSTFKGKQSFFLGDLYVVPKCRQDGVGKKLFQHVVNEAKSNGCCRVDWYVTDSNAYAKIFYDRLGAKKISTKTIYSIEIQ